MFDTMAGVEAAQLQTVLVQAEQVLIKNQRESQNKNTFIFSQVDAECPEADWNIEDYSPSLELLKEVKLTTKMVLSISPKLGLINCC